MALLTPEQVKAVVVACLEIIANLPAGDVEAGTFDATNDEQKRIFLENLKSKINALPYYKDDGETTYALFYDIAVSLATFTNWATVGDCINWIVANQGTFPRI